MIDERITKYLIDLSNNLQDISNLDWNYFSFVKKNPCKKHHVLFTEYPIKDFILAFEYNYFPNSWNLIDFVLLVFFIKGN